MLPAWYATHRDVLTVEGADAATYLQGQLSQDVAALAVGATALTLVLAPQGKVDGWGRVHRVGEERFEIDADEGSGLAWSARLNRFLMRTKATIALAEGVPMIAVRGALVPGGLDAGWPGVEGSDLLGDQHAPEGAVELDAAGYAALRIRAGVPAWGHEIDADTIPASLGAWVVEASASFTKGCYTGQELVARMDSRGNNAPTRLAGVVLGAPAGALPQPGAELTADGVPAGRITSVGVDAGGAVALAFVPRSIEVPSSVLVDGVAAELVPLPIA